MKKLYFLWLSVFTCSLSMGQIQVNSLTTPYTQNFDELASSGTSSATPQGWLFAETGSLANSTYAADNGATGTGNTYSYGTAGTTERAFGSLLSGNLTPIIGAYFTNNSNAVITSITLSYSGERWRLGTMNRVDSLIFQYSTNATSLTTGTYATVNQLSYGVAASSVAVGALDGNASANRTAITATISGLSISPNTTFYFRWNDYNATGADDGLAIDDVTINFNGNVQQPCAAPTAQPTALTFNTVTNTSFNTVFTPASPAADEYLAVISTSATLNASPVNGTTYNTDDAIGNGVVTYRGSSTSFSLTSLTPGTTYYLFIFSVNSNCSGGPLYLTSNPLTGSQATTAPAVCVAPSGPVSNVVFSSITGNSISGSFTGVADADGYLVIRSTSSTLGFTPVNGTQYPVGSTAGSGTIIKYGSGNTFSTTGLAVSTTYYFTFYSLNGFNCTNGPVYNATAVAASTATNTNTSGIPSGYYDTVTTQTCSPLKSVLKWRTYPSVAPKTYGDLWTQYLVSDIKPRELNPGTGSANVIWDIYSDNPTGTDPYNFTPGTVASGGQQDNGTNTSTEGQFYNREHSVPQSWFKGDTQIPGPTTDYHHIFPTDKVVNALRSNYIYGEVTNPTNTSRNGSKLGPNAFAGLTGTAFEPINEYKGDLARAFLYFVTRYQDSMAIFLNDNDSREVGQAFEPNIYPSVDVPYLRLMLKWHNQDPVSQKEIDRNNAAFTYQGNRNPFIDHPEYADRIWNSGCLPALPVHLLSFKGLLRGDKVVLTWEVQNEDNLQGYEIERSDNNRTFTTIGRQGATNSSIYQYTDEVSSLTGRRLYYRLRKVDKDGQYSYSPVFTVHVPLSLSFSVYPNPVSGGTMNVLFGKPAAANATLQLLDAAGKTLQQVPVLSGTSNLSIPVKGLAKGTYLLRLVQPGSAATVQQVQVQ